MNVFMCKHLSAFKMISFDHRGRKRLADLCYRVGNGQQSNIERQTEAVIFFFSPFGLLTHKVILKNYVSSSHIFSVDI